MRLKHVHIISVYKNLKDFKLDFDGKSFIDVFVGKNGTGKSNLFEALIEIFKHLFEKEHIIYFSYHLVYEINGEQIDIRWEKEQLLLNGKIVKVINKKLLPDNILIYYSGHNSKITDLVNQYEENFKRDIKKADINDTREFIGIGKEYKSLLLSVLLIQEDNNKAKQFICKKLGITNIGDEVTLTLRRPYYAESKAFDIVNNDDSDRFWKPEGITKIFLERLRKCQTTNTKGRERREGYLTDKDVEEYVFYYSIKAIQKEFKELSSQELFRQFDNLKTIEMLNDISVELKLENGSDASINHFSDGQFQSVYIYSVIELFKDRNCLTLLDEPDSFLHPEWQFEFLKQVFEITENVKLNNHVLMSSHSAVTLVPHTQKHIKLFHFIDNKLECHQVNKNYAINQMSSNLMRYSEDEQILSILHSINIENKPVFFTEGSTDPIIIKEAWQKLYKDEMPFIPIYAFNCVYLRSLLQDQRIFNELGKKPLFGLFDFDEAYNEWNYIKGKVIEENPYKGLILDIENTNSYAFMLPVPSIPEVEKQVIKDKKNGKTFLHESRMTIEHLFYGDKGTHSFFEMENKPGGGSILSFKADKKTRFASEVVPKISKEHFEVFRPLFDFVKAKC